MATVTAFSLALNEVRGNPDKVRSLFESSVLASRKIWTNLSPSAKRAECNYLLCILVFYSSEAKHFKSPEKYALASFPEDFRAFLRSTGDFLETQEQKVSLQKIVPAPRSPSPPPRKTDPSLTRLQRETALLRIALTQTQESSALLQSQLEETRQELAELRQSQEQQSAYFNKKFRELRKRAREEEGEKEAPPSKKIKTTFQITTNDF
jgi:hypothetical protein